MKFLKRILKPFKTIGWILLCMLIVFVVGILDLIGLLCEPFGKRKAFEQWIDDQLVKWYSDANKGS